MRYYWNALVKEVVKLFTILYVPLLLSGCSPGINSGDLTVSASGSSAILSGPNNGYIKYTAIYGSEHGHPDHRKSDISYGHSNLLVSLFILVPKDAVLYGVGGGNGDIPLYYQLIYNNTNWLLYPVSYFAKKKSNGTFDLANKKTFLWGFDGKKRTITIANNTYTISPGDYVIVKLDKHWNPIVGVGEESFEKLQISSVTRSKILKCYITIKKGIHALGKC